MKDVVARFTPPRRPGGIDPTTLWRPGVLEALAAEAGLTPDRAFDPTWAYEFADEAELVRAMTSAGGFGAIARRRAAGGRARRDPRGARRLPRRPAAATGIAQRVALPDRPRA